MIGRLPASKLHDAEAIGLDSHPGLQQQNPEEGMVAASKTSSADAQVDQAVLQEILDALIAARDGDFSRRLSRRRRGIAGEIGAAYNELIARNGQMVKELARVRRVIGREGRMDQRATLDPAGGGWEKSVESLNALIDDLVRPTTEVARVLDAVADGDLDRKMALTIEGQPVKGEFLRIGTTVNTMVDQLSSFADEVTRVAREVGTEGKLGGQAEVKGVSGTWRALTESVNNMASNLTDQVRNISQVAQAVARGDLSQKITVEAKGEVAELADTINEMTDTLAIFAEQVTSVAREVGTEGKLGGQAEVPNVSGTWKDLTESVNGMASNLTSQVRNIAQVMTAVAGGDLTQRITVDVKGEILELKVTTNTMVDQLSSFADEVTRVAREVGTEGKLGGQAEVPNVAGTWKDLTDSVNLMASNLTDQVRAIKDVAIAVTEGDLTRMIMVEAKGELDELKRNINQMIANLRQTTEKNEEQDWLKSNLAKFGRIMQGQKDLDSVAGLIMSELTPLVGAQHGAFFIKDGESADAALALIASYAYKARKHVSNRFHLGEGLVGQSALEKKPILLTGIPEDYIQINSALGEAPPRNIIVLPILFEGDVKAVVELASFLPFGQ